MNRAGRSAIVSRGGNEKMKMRIGRARTQPWIIHQSSQHENDNKIMKNFNRRSHQLLSFVFLWKPTKSNNKE